jgi:hypothetical protein
MPYLKLGHSRSFIKQSEGYTTEQVLEEKNAFIRKNPAHRIGGLGSLMQPLEALLAINLDGCRNCERIVRTDFLDELAIPGGTGIGYDDEIKGTFFTPVAL